MENWQTTTNVDPPLAPAIEAVRKRYPRLQPHLDNAAIAWAPDPGDGRQMETYPPWETDNPNPGKLTMELYNRKIQGETLNQALAADALHHIASVNPETGQPIDPEYRALRQQMIDSFTPEQHASNQRAYARAQAQYNENRPYNAWMDTSRADAYMRGAIFPDINPDWKGSFSPDQEAIADRARRLLEQGQD